MNELQAIEALAAQARREQPPTTNVPIGNIRRAASPQPMQLFPWICTGAVSALAATVAICLALRTSTPNTQAIIPLFNAAQVELP